MESKKVKPEEKTLRQMCEEINQKLDATKEKREALRIAANQVRNKNILMECASNVLDNFSSFDISTYGINFQKRIKIYYCGYGRDKVSLSKIITAEALQKVLDEFSPEQFIVKEINFYSNDFIAIVELV